jgi:hypothetical protein
MTSVAMLVTVPQNFIFLIVTIVTEILPVFLYVYEAWSVTVREEQRLNVFENRVMRRIFGLRLDKTT